MNAPHSKLFDSLPKQIRNELILGKRTRFVYKGKSYKLTDGDGSEYTKISSEINEMIEKCKFNKERSNKINKIKQRISGKLPSKRYWWSNIKFFV